MLRVKVHHMVRDRMVGNRLAVFVGAGGLLFATFCHSLFFCYLFTGSSLSLSFSLIPFVGCVLFFCLLLLSPVFSCQFRSSSVVFLNFVVLFV